MCRLNLMTNVYHSELVLIPCLNGQPPRPEGWGLLGAVGARFQSLWSQSCGWSVGWQELSWHLTAWE